MKPSRLGICTPKVGLENQRFVDESEEVDQHRTAVSKSGAWGGIACESQGIAENLAQLLRPMLCLSARGAYQRQCEPQSQEFVQQELVIF